MDAFLKMLSVFADEKYVEECAKSLIERSRKGERIMGCDISAAWPIWEERKDWLQAAGKAWLQVVRKVRRK